MRGGGGFCIFESTRRYFHSLQKKYSSKLDIISLVYSYLCVAETKDKMQIDMNELQDNYNPLAIPSEFVSDVHSIIERGRQQAYASVGQISIATFWNVGRRIVEEEQRGETRAAYGKQLIKNLAETLVPQYGNSYSKRNLDYYRKFYLLFPDLEIVNTCVHNLEWSHIRRVLSVATEGQKQIMTNRH